jgi:hypothetical protein
VTEENDHDACVVWGWLVNDPEHLLWERESWEGRGDSEEFCARVVETYRRWRPMVAMCGDTGGAGAVKALATISKRLNGLRFEPKPTSVELSQRLTNDELRAGRMKLNPLGCVAKGAKVCIKGRHEADIMAAARYGHHGVYNFLAKAPPTEPTETLDEQIKRRRHEAWAKEKRTMHIQWSTRDGGWQG